MKQEMFVFRLYVAGTAPNSMEAIDNLTHLCDTYLPGRHEIEIVDICVDPGRALDEAIYMTPTLVTLSPNPGQRIVGTLRNTEPILQILGIRPASRRPIRGVKERRPAAQVRRPS